MPKPRLDITPEADRDIKEALEFTEVRWGRNQATQYRAAITTALTRLRRFPNLGRDRAEIKVGLRSLVVKHHVIIYEVGDGVVRVVRMLNEREDEALALSGTEGLPPEDA